MNIIDLSHYIEPGMSLFPGATPPRLEPGDSGGFQVTALSLGNHQGTHVDAPRHLLRSGAGLDQLAISRFFGLSLLLDVSVYGGQEIPEAVFKEQADILSHCQFITLKTNWDKHWGRPEYLSGYPLLSPAAAHYLTRFSLSGVAADCLSLDPVGGEAVHRILLGAGLILVENLTSLNQVKGPVFLLSALPLKWHNCDGSPVRAVAMEAPAGIYYPG